jgi:hypothetical protein
MICHWMAVLYEHSPDYLGAAGKVSGNRNKRLLQVACVKCYGSYISALTSERIFSSVSIMASPIVKAIFQLFK